MTIVAALSEGSRALSEGRWESARESFDAALTAASDGSARARALVGLSDTAWWSGDVGEALRTRRQAYETWRRAGDDVQAARAAVWLAREYLGALGNDAAARGWLTRAETLAGEPPAAELAGWIALVRAMLHPQPQITLEEIDAVLRAARGARDGDLEALVLARRGLSLVARGDLNGALDSFHEAMALATGGETSLQTLGYLCCDLAWATELWGDPQPFAQWNDIVMRVAAEHGHPPLVAFCATCCAEVFTAGGDWQGAEQQLRSALTMLRETGQRARCTPPAARLGELLVLQGRLEEADEVLGGDRSEETLLARARLALARGNGGAAVTLLERARRRQGSDSLLTVRILALLVEAHLTVGRPVEAEEAAGRLLRMAQQTGNRRVSGRAALALGRVLCHTGDTVAAAGLLEEALDHLSACAPGGLELADAQLELARLRMAEAPDVALDDARAALAVYEQAGATARADEAAALARSLGDRRRVGPKGSGTLTRREQEVLRLVALGLTNAEVAERLFISPKTAENHVSHILTKLNLRSRTEAAAYALAHPS